MSTPRMTRTLALLCALLPAVAGLRAAGLARPSHAAAAAPRAACAVMAPKPKEVKLDPAREKLVKGGLPQRGRGAADALQEHRGDPAAAQLAVEDQGDVR